MNSEKKITDRPKNDITDKELIYHRAFEVERSDAFESLKSKYLTEILEAIKENTFLYSLPKEKIKDIEKLTVICAKTAMLMAIDIYVYISKEERIFMICIKDCLLDMFLREMSYFRNICMFSPSVSFEIENGADNYCAIKVKYRLD